MSEDWQTKYGTRRVRRDPPTLEEAIFAAAGITEDHEAQAEIAAALMGMDYEPVLAEVKKTSRIAASSSWLGLARSMTPLDSPWLKVRCAPNLLASKRIASLPAPVVMRRLL